MDWILAYSSDYQNRMSVCYGLFSTGDIKQMHVLAMQTSLGNLVWLKPEDLSSNLEIPGLSRVGSPEFISNNVELSIESVPSKNSLFWLLYSFAHSLFHSLSHSFIHSFMYSIYSLIHLSIYLFIDVFVYCTFSFFLRWRYASSRESCSIVFCLWSFC